MTRQISLGQYLRESRIAAGLTQAETARRLRAKLGESFEQSYINRIELGRIRQPDIVRLKALCEEYGCDFATCLKLGEYPGYRVKGESEEGSPLRDGIDDILSSWSEVELNLLFASLPDIRAQYRKIIDVLGHAAS